MEKHTTAFNNMNTQLMLEMQIKSKNEALATAKVSLQAIQTELHLTKEMLNSRDVDLQTTKTTLASTEAKLQTTQTKLNSTKSKLKKTKAKYCSTQKKLKETKAALNTQKELRKMKEESTVQQNNPIIKWKYEFIMYLILISLITVYFLKENTVIGNQLKLDDRYRKHSNVNYWNKPKIEYFKYY